MKILTSFRGSALLGAAFLSSLLVACGGSDGPKSEIMIFTVSEKPEVCIIPLADSSSFCPPSAEDKNSDKTLLFSSYITGFTHEFGVAYELRVQRDPYEDEIADGPDADYTLLEILDTNQVAQLGDIYAYDIPLDGSMFEVQGGTYYIGRYQFNCGEGIDCQQLVDMDGSGSLVTVEFTYVGGEIPITLTSWN